MNKTDVTREQVKAWLPARKQNSHKGDYGKPAIVAGSPGMMGAACLAALAALRSGAGLVRLVVPESQFVIPQITVLPATCVSRTRWREAVEWADAVAIGPGMGLDEEAEQLLQNVTAACREQQKPLVIDADGLTLLAKKTAELGPSQLPTQTVLTPHAGEAARLLQTTPQAIEADRLQAVRTIADRFGCTALLKGHQTLTATCGSDTVYRNTTGNCGLATGGSGDVLTGIIAAFLGQHTEPQKAAAAAAFLHGSAADLAVRAFGEDGLTAADLPLYIACVLLDMRE